MAEPKDYPAPSEELTKMMIGAQLHHAKLADELQVILEVIDAKLKGLLSQPDPDASEINKLKRLRHETRLHLDKMRYGGLEASI